MGNDSVDRDNSPGDAFGVEHRRKDSLRRPIGQPDRPRQNPGDGDGLKVEEIEARVSSGHGDHGRNSRAGVGQPDVRAQVEQAEDGSSLLVAGKLLKWPGEMAAGGCDGGAAGPVVPVGGRVQRETLSGVREPHQELLDQETVVEDNNAFGSQGSGLLIGEVGIVDRRQAGVVAIPEHSPQLLACDRGASGYDQSCVAKIDEADLAALFDAPPPT